MSLKYFFIFITVGLVISSCNDPQPVKETNNSVPHEEITSLPTLVDSVNYLIGMNLANQFQYFNDEDYRPESMELAMQDFFSVTGEFRLVKEQRDELLKSYFRWARAHKLDSMLRKSEAFLAENLKKDGIQLSPRGIQYEVIKSGNKEGISPDGNDMVNGFYRQGTPDKGMIWDLKELGSTQDTTNFSLNLMFTGISEICQLMKPGDHYRAWIPPAFGSSENEDPLKVAEANEVIIMEFEMIEVVERATAEIGDELKQRPGYFIDESRRNN